MMRAVKAVTTYRGRDPRDFALFAFGGNGGVHAARPRARAPGSAASIVPPAAGVFSALGLLFADARAQREPRLPRRLATASPIGRGGAASTTARRRASRRCSAARATEIAFQRLADVRFVGQAFELTVPLPDGALRRRGRARLRRRFDAEHLARYGHAFAGQYPGRDRQPAAGRHASRRQGARRIASLGSAAAAAEARSAQAYFGPRPAASPRRSSAREPARRDAAPGPAGDRGIRGHGRRAARRHRARAMPTATSSSSSPSCTQVSSPMRSDVDPFQLEILKSSFDTIADDMALTLMRTAHSGIVRDSHGFLHRASATPGPDAGAGRCTPMQLGSFYDAMRNLIAPLSRAASRPGDVFIFNDPYVAGGQHLPDIYIVTPIYFEDRHRRAGPDDARAPFRRRRHRRRQQRARRPRDLPGGPAPPVS